MSMEGYESPNLNLYALSVELERATKWMDIEPQCRRFAFVWDGKQLNCSVWSVHQDGRVRHPGIITETGGFCFGKALATREQLRAERPQND